MDLPANWSGENWTLVAQIILTRIQNLQDIMIVDGDFPSSGVEWDKAGWQEANTKVLHENGTNW